MHKYKKGGAVMDVVSEIFAKIEAIVKLVIEFINSIVPKKDEAAE